MESLIESTTNTLIENSSGSSIIANWIYEHGSWIFGVQSVLGTAALFLYSRYRLKQKRFSFFYLLFAGIHSLMANGYFNLFAQFPFFSLPFHLYFNAALFLHLFVLGHWKKLKPWWYLNAIAFPGYWYLALGFIGSMAAIPYSIGTRWMLPLFVNNGIMNQHLPLLDAGFNGLVMAISLHALYISVVGPKFAKEVVHIDLRSETTRGGEILSQEVGGENDENQTVVEIDHHTEPVHHDESNVLRVFQITDPHLGTCMSKEKLKALCQNIVDHRDQIDLVLITGDMETMDTHNDDHSLSEALSPLKELKGKTIACLGNHDYEVLERVREAYRQNDIILLEDDQAIVEVERLSKLRGEKAQVQIVGSQFSFAGVDSSTRHIQELSRKFPKIAQNVPKLFLIHNPSILSSMSLRDDTDLIFSGHLHGGHIGTRFKRLTFVKVLFSALRLFGSKKIFKVHPPDQGLYGRGALRLYAHRGTGHYGFPLRIGVSSEYSLMKLYF